MSLSSISQPQQTVRGLRTPSLASAGWRAAAPRAHQARAQRIDLVLVGARGQVGSAFRRQLARLQTKLRDGAGLDLALIAAFDRRGFAFDLQGLAPDDLDRQLVARGGDDVERLLEHVARPGAARTVLIDCTASDEIADAYLRLLAAGVGVVGANKRANSRSFAEYHLLQATARDSGAPYRYETTVGAAIPLLGPLRDLRLRGERVLGIQGVLSGSLSYILHRLHDGCAFSEALAEAVALGYTEPDPLEDLHATDLSRKLLVLARESGFALESADLRIEPLVAIDGDAGQTLSDALPAADREWKQRIADALGRDERWVVIAEADADGARVGLHRLPASSPFAQLRPGQNLVQVRTELQDATPLGFSGPGAGAEVTAAGVLSDVVAAASQLAGR